jgi:hypothetical protein
VTVEDAQGNTVIQTTLTPVADASYLYGSAGQLSDPCNGLFTFRVTTANSQQDVFVAFMDRAVLFASFTAPLAIAARQSVRLPVRSRVEVALPSGRRSGLGSRVSSGTPSTAKIGNPQRSPRKSLSLRP